MNIPKGYKMTEVGMIPEDWEYALFKDIFTFYPTNTYARDFMNDSEGEVFNVHYGDILVRYGSILDFEKTQVPFLNADSTNWSNRALLKDGDIIIADTAEDETCGKLTEVYGLREKKAVSGLHTMLCRPKEDLFVPKFLGYFMNGAFYHNQLLPLMVGTKVTSVSKSAILDTWILIPPKEIQQHIADALTDIDRLIEPINAEIEKKRQIKEGAMQALLTGKKRLPGYSGEWVSYQLCDILSYEQPTPYLVGSTDYVEKGTPVLTAGKTFVLGYTNESWGIYDKLPVIIFDDFVTESKYVNFPFKAKSSAMKMLRLKNEANNLRFIYEIMQMIDFPMTDHKRYWIGEYSKIFVTIPSPKEQNAIAKVLSDMDDEIKFLEAQRDKYMLIKQGMMQELLTGKTRLV